MSNQNTAEKDAFGRTKRSASLAGMVGADTTGTLIVRTLDGLEFGIGSGLNDEMREEIQSLTGEQIFPLLMKLMEHVSGIPIPQVTN